MSSLSKYLNKRLIYGGLFVSIFFFTQLCNASGVIYVPMRPAHCQTRASASSIVSPTGYGLGWGQIGLGVGYVNHWIGSEGDDGYGVVSMGFGDPYKVALTASVLFDSVGVNESFAKNGTAGFKLSHEFADSLSAIAIGVANGIPWGALKHEANSYYAVGTHVFNLSGDPTDRLDFIVSAGVGSGAFYSTDAFRNGDEKVSVFASVALRVLPNLSFIANWAAEDLALGISVAPFRNLPLVLGASVLNMAGENSSSKAFLLTAGIGFNFLR